MVEYEILDSKKYRSNSSDIKMICDRFEVLQYGYENTPVLFVRRYLKNSDNKLIYYNTFVEKEDYLYEKNVVNCLLKDAIEESDVEQLAIRKAYHDKFGNGIKQKEIMALERSEEYDLNQNNLTWFILGNYMEKNLLESKSENVLSLKR